LRGRLEHFRDVLIVDATFISLYQDAEDVYRATGDDQTGLKLHLIESLSTGLPTRFLADSEWRLTEQFFSNPNYRNIILITLIRIQPLDTTTMQQTTAASQAPTSNHTQRATATSEFVVATLVFAGLLTLIAAPGVILGMALGAGVVTLGRRLKERGYSFGRRMSTARPKITRKGIA
jgi:hypothetical protein